MEEGPDFLPNGTINFHKMGLVGDVLNEIHRFQVLQHSFSPVLPMQEFIISCGASALDDTQLYNCSKTIEPKREI